MERLLLRFNTAVGVEALVSNVDGNSNAAVGVNALGSNISGSFNTAIGDFAGTGNTSGDGNIYIGAFSGSVPNGESNVTRIGDPVFQSACFIAGINGQTAIGGAAVSIDANGKLGTVTSSQRFKDDIKPMDKSSEELFSLKPVSFRYKKEIDPSGTPQLGLVAEEVEKVNPALVVRDKEGKPYSVRYEQVNAMLLNEFLKEHRKVHEQDARLTKQEATIAGQQKQIEALSAGLEKVNAELEVSKRPSQVVVNDQ